MSFQNQPQPKNNLQIIRDKMDNNIKSQIQQYVDEKFKKICLDLEKLYESVGNLETTLMELSQLLNENKQQNNSRLDDMNMLFVKKNELSSSLSSLLDQTEEIIAIGFTNNDYQKQIDALRKEITELKEQPKRLFLNK